MGVELCGYGVFLGRRSHGVHDELFCRALVVGDGETRIAILANDLVGVSRALSERVRHEVEISTGIPRDNVVVTATHTHSGPAVPFLRGWGEIDPAYLETLPGKMAMAAVRASSRLRPARIAVGRGALAGVGYNRADREKPIDPEVAVLQVATAEGDAIATLFSFACHPVMVDYRTDEGRLISAEYPGHVEQLLENSHPGSIGMFLQGACGDINPHDVWKGFSRVEALGESLAGEVMRILADLS